jgi:uncharacterized membrane protein YkvA (DUF1232 family)
MEGDMALSGVNNATAVKQGFFPKLARVLAHVPFAEDLVAAYYCAFDSTTPLKARGILVAALAYFILPFDVIPDFGFTDDAAVLVAALSVIRAHLTQAHRDKARETLDRLKTGQPASV